MKCDDRDCLSSKLVIEIKKIRFCLSKFKVFALALRCDLRAFPLFWLVLFNFFSICDPERFAVSLNSVSRIADPVLYREKIERGRESP